MIESPIAHKGILLQQILQAAFLVIIPVKKLPRDPIIARALFFTNQRHRVNVRPVAAEN